jgi:hypothetical protein
MNLSKDEHIVLILSLSKDEDRHFAKDCSNGPGGD